MRFSRSFCEVSHWVVALAPLSALCWFGLLSYRISLDIGNWPHVFWSDISRYGDRGTAFNLIYYATLYSARLTLVCAYLLPPTFFSLWAMKFAPLYRCRWVMVSALSWSTFLLTDARKFYSILWS
jgi:hypothetical protein